MSQATLYVFFTVEARGKCESSEHSDELRIETHKANVSSVT